MVTKAQLKFYASLKERKARIEHGLFIAEGHKIVKEGLKSRCKCAIIFVRKGFVGYDDETRSLMAGQCVEILEEADFNKLSRTDNPQGVLGVFDYRGLLISKVSDDNVIVLFDLADPRNMGTIIRSADWFGLREIVLSETCVDILNEKVIRSTMGSIFHCRFLVAGDLIKELTRMKPAYRVLTADLGGSDFRNPRQAGKKAFVFSNEAHGPSDAILALTDEILTIPGGGRAESLNVANAAAIIMATIIPPPLG